MTARLLSVDLENVHKIDLSGVPSDADVMIFHNSNQKSFPRTLVTQTPPFGSRLQWIRIAGQGPNALDFHIAYYLGQRLAKVPEMECAILSRDTGFDPLVAHLRAQGRQCRRVESLEGAFTPSASKLMSELDRAIELLRADRARPARRRGLEGRLKSWFPKLTTVARSTLLTQLFESERVVEEGKALRYRFEGPQETQQGRPTASGSAKSGRVRSNSTPP